MNFEKAKQYFLEGVILFENKEFKEAEVSFLKALSLFPERASILTNLSAVQIKLNKFSEAQISAQKAIMLDKNNGIAYLNLGIIEKENLNFILAIKYLKLASSYEKNNPEAFFHQGLIYNELKRYSEAIACYNEAIRLKPEFSEAHYGRGCIYHELKSFDEALVSYSIVNQLKPNFAEAQFNRGNVLYELKVFDEALTSYDKAIFIKPDYADAYYNRGNVLKELKQLDGALLSYKKAISIQSNYAQAFNNCGNILTELKYFVEAVSSYSEAIQINKDYAEAHFNRGNCFRELGRLEDALADYEKAINIKKDYAEAYTNRGNVLKDLKHFDEAVASYDEALRIEPDYPYLLGFSQHVRALIANWEDFDRNKKLILQKIDSGKGVADPFALLAITDAPSTNRACSEIYIQEKFPPNNKLGNISKRDKKNKIRLGYYSADLHNHAVSFLIAELIEIHNKEKFELIAFSFGPDIKDKMRNRLSTAFDQFIDVRNKSDEEVAILSRQLEIDIAIDLAGYTFNSRTGIFAYRAAPIQINYLGYPGTLGSKYIDYIIADQILIPPAFQKHYSEKIVYLPNSYQVNDSTRLISDKQFTKAELGLPKEGFIFACFNNNYKIVSSTFDLWCNILRKVDASILWLLADNPTAKKNLIKEAIARGISSNRLVFAERLDPSEHLARHRHADLFLDTFPYNAHTTASDALWAGLPLLTMMGESFASRVAASLLNAIDLPELITSSQEHYEALAIELASNPARLKVIKDKLERNRLTTPLFDTPRFTKHLEDAYIKMYERHHADLPTEHIYIDN